MYLKGRYYWNRRTDQTLKRAVEYFQQAIDKDPAYALAYAGLADCYAVYAGHEVGPPREAGPKARAAATKALEIDNTLAAPHAALAFTKTHYEWDWAGAEREFQRSIKLDPNYAKDLIGAQTSPSRERHRMLADSIPPGILGQNTEYGL